ncbi:MAG: 2TM domain-containing protein [Fimbriimonadaceae bacterium]
MRHEYEEKDIQEILNRAVRADVIRQTGREALLMNARELGISDEALAQAELEYLREKTRSEEKREFVAERRRGYWEHLASYVIVNTFLLCLNLLNWNGHLWAIYPILGWGIGIAFHTVEAFSSRVPESDREFARWKKRRERRAEESSIEEESGLILRARIGRGGSSSDEDDD